MRLQASIYLDDITKKFLSSLRNLREKKGLTLSQVQEATDMQKQILSCYEIGKCCPSIERLFKLADFYGYDLSESFNYAFGKDFLNQKRKLLREIEKYNIDFFDLADLTGYCVEYIRIALRANGEKVRCLICLGAIYKAVEDEKERLKNYNAHIQGNDKFSSRLSGNGRNRKSNEGA